MGLISQLAEGKSISLNSGLGSPRPSNTQHSREFWRRTFNVSKEGEDQFPRVRPGVTPGGSYGRSAIAEPAAFKRLLQAMRSKAPGGWTDDRWEEEKHFTSTPYLAIHRICLQLMQAEFQVFRKDLNAQGGKRPISPMDPPEGGRQVKPYDLVKVLEKPNNQDSFGRLMYQWGQQIRLTGTALTWMVPNYLGVPMELYPIPTAIAIPQPAINPDYPHGYYRIQPLYPYGPFSSYPTPATAVGAPIPAQWMIKFQYPHPLVRYDGYSPLTGMRMYVDEVDSIDESRWWAMKRGVNPSAVLQFDELEGIQALPEPEIDRVRAEFENTLMGPQNTGQLFVSAPGARLEQWGSRPMDMEYQAGWDQLVSIILAGFGITKPAAGMVESSSYATLFATLKQLHVQTLDPECSMFAAHLTKDLAPFFGDDLIVEIRCKRIDDHDLRNAVIQVAMNARAITKNQVLELLDLPKTNEKWGDEIAGTEPQPEGGGLAALLGGGAGGGQPGLPSPGQMPAEPEGAPNPITGMAEAAPGAGPGGELKLEPSDIQNTKPKPGGPGRGSLGPRKSMNGRVPESRLKAVYSEKGLNGQQIPKSLYDQVREACRNGHH